MGAIFPLPAGSACRYAQTYMRRLASLVMLALLLLMSGMPLQVAAMADAESQLPPCCRRHGQHHCAMLDAWLRAHTSGSPAVTGPPAHCPFYPQPSSQSATTARRAFLPQSRAAVADDQPVAGQFPCRVRGGGSRNLDGAWPKRGPPCATLLKSL